MIIWRWWWKMRIRNVRLLVYLSSAQSFIMSRIFGTIRYFFPFEIINHFCLDPIAHYWKLLPFLQNGGSHESLVYNSLYEIYVVKKCVSLQTKQTAWLRTKYNPTFCLDNGETLNLARIRSTTPAKPEESVDFCTFAIAVSSSICSCYDLTENL